MLLLNPKIQTITLRYEVVSSKAMGIQDYFVSVWISEFAFVSLYSMLKKTPYIWKVIPCMCIESCLEFLVFPLLPLPEIIGLSGVKWHFISVCNHGIN